MTSRRRFLATLGAASLLGCRAETVPGVPPGELLGTDLGIGHRLRAGRLPPPGRRRRTHTLIVGAGVAGLSAAWALDKAAVDDFLVLEMEREAGGNSRAGQSSLTAFPWGAHYLPLPGPEAVRVRELLAELGVLQGSPDAVRPIYDERYLCAAPQERLYRHGLWEEGLLAQRGIGRDERAQQQRFQARMAELKAARGRDGRPLFALPMARSSTDPAWRALDRGNFRQWLLDAGYTAPSLHWLANYACRDDYGTDYAQTSAWAGLHYFASRRGEAANAAADCVLTAPEGNAWLVRGLARRAGDRLLPASLVWRVERGRHGVTVDALCGEESVRFEARRLIWAAPLFLLPHVWPGMPGRLREAAQAIDYAPWLVANLHLAAWPEERPGAEPAWDNVLYDGPGLGYVTATHQGLRRPPAGTVFTYYRPLTEYSPAAGRRLLLETRRETWAAAILDELQRAHPDLRQRVSRLDVFANGHAMCRPRPGSLFDGRRQRLADFDDGRIVLGHADLSGFSLFEEAQYRGVRAALGRRRA